MATLFIPPLGTVLTLAAPWTFTVYHEHRNTSLVKLAGLERPDDKDRWRTREVGQFTFPAGTKLTVDRIYIRQGGEAFNSVTFRAREYTADRFTTFRDKSVRFWAKLEEVNGMEVCE